MTAREPLRSRAKRLVRLLDADAPPESLRAECDLIAESAFTLLGPRERDDPDRCDLLRRLATRTDLGWARLLAATDAELRGWADADPQQRDNSRLVGHG